jgi:cell division protein FtsQ
LAGKTKIWSRIIGLPYKAILTVTIAIAMVVSAAVFKYNSPVKELVISIESLPAGKNLVTVEDIQKLLMKSFKSDFVGWKVKDIDVGMIEEDVQLNEFVRQAEIYIDARNRLTIHIIQREPVLRIQDENGMSFYLDSEGFRMPISRHYAARVKVATGELPHFKGKHLMEASPVYKSLFLASQVIAKDPFYEALIEQIYVDKKGEFHLSPKVGNQRIRLGTVENIETKLDKLRTFLKEGLAHEGWQACEIIDLRFSEQIVCTKRDQKLSIKNSIK